jgi:hypothetical protein
MRAFRKPRNLLAAQPYEPGDEQGPYTRAQLVMWDQHFVERVERAFEMGRERRVAAQKTNARLRST